MQEAYRPPRSKCSLCCSVFCMRVGVYLHPVPVVGGGIQSQQGRGYSHPVLMGYPHWSDTSPPPLVRWGTPPPSGRMEVPLPVRKYRVPSIRKDGGTSSGQEGWGYPAHQPDEVPPCNGGQSENITFRHPSEQVCTTTACTRIRYYMGRQSVVFFFIFFLGRGL